MEYREYSEALVRFIRPQTSPLGIKLLSSDEEAGTALARPAKYGIKISLCQWVTMARRWDRPLAVLAEDVNCAPCLAALGLKRMKDDSALVDYFMDMGYFQERELAVKAAERLEPLPAGEVRGLTVFPLAQAETDPDLVVVYGSPAQMARLAAAFVYQSGELVPSATTGFGISCLSMLKPHWRGGPALVIPGRGERILAGTEEGEMYCSFPAGLLEPLLNGLEKTQERGTRYPVQRYVLYQPPEIPAFKPLSRALEDV